MREVTGDIWSYVEQGWLVIPISLALHSNGRATMSVGVASQARVRYSDLDRVLYNLIMMGGSKPQLHCLFGSGIPFRGGLIFFPTRERPIERAKFGFINAGLRNLPLLPIVGNIYLPLIGCGYGRREEREILPLMQQYLVDDRFTLVRRGPEVFERYPDAFRSHVQGNRYEDRSLYREWERTLKQTTGTTPIEEKIRLLDKMIEQHEELLAFDTREKSVRNVCKRLRERRAALARTIE